MRSVRGLMVGVALFGLAGLVRAEEPKKPTATTGAEIGKPAPDFTLKDMDGKEHKLSSLKGKIVVLEWATHKCPFCLRHYKEKTMANTYTSFKDKGVVWFAIDSSNWAEKDKDQIGKWWKEQGSPFPYLLDADGKVGRAFGAKNTPHMFVIDVKGVLAYQGAIDDDPDGTKDKDVNYVADAINALLKGTAVATATTKPYGCSVKYAN